MASHKILENANTGGGNKSENETKTYYFPIVFPTLGRRTRKRRFSDRRKAQ
jgi:hypothetical protein